MFILPYLDLSKTFYTYQLYINKKSKHFGVDVALKLLESYVTDQKQFTSGCSSRVHSRATPILDLYK